VNKVNLIIHLVAPSHRVEEDRKLTVTLAAESHSLPGTGFACLLHLQAVLSCPLMLCLPCTKDQNFKPFWKGIPLFAAIPFDQKGKQSTEYSGFKI
jgi:hypothetical protein